MISQSSRMKNCGKLASQHENERFQLCGDRQQASDVLSNVASGKPDSPTFGVAMNRDSDLIKALGFVALYAAYVEEGVDIVMLRLSKTKPYDESQSRLPTSRKIAWCESELATLNSPEITRVTGLLGEAKRLLVLRNEVIHGRIYVGFERGEMLASGRMGVPDRSITADELYDLAEQLHAVQAALPCIDSFATIRAIEAKQPDPKLR